MNEKLFDDFERTDTNRNNFVVERYTFLNTSAVDEAERARKKIHAWSDGFPVTNEFLKRFRSKKNKQHTAALFELFVFHYFKNRGFLIEALDRGKTATPDFKINVDGKTVYVECTCSSNSGITDTIDELQSVILDSFQKIDKQEYYINIEWLVCAQRTPSLKKIRHFIRDYINDQHRARQLFIEDAGWIIKITLMPASSSVRRGIGIIQNPGQLVTPHLNVLTALNDKRPSKYDLDFPYIIALHSEDMFLGHLDMELALFEGARFHDKLPVKLGRDIGFFIAKQQLVNSSVSAVLLVQKLSPYSDESPKMMLYNHPEPKYTFAKDKLPMSQQWFKKIDEANYQVFNTPELI